MGSKNYSQLSLKERIEIYHWHANGISLRNIGLRLGRSASTISRELKRNSKPSKRWQAGYCPERAQTLTKRRMRRRCRYKLARQPNLLVYVKEQLVMGRSPEQIAGRLALEHGRTIISPESIYRFIYWRCHSFKEHYYKLLPRQHYNRRHRGYSLKRSGKSPILGRVSIHQRPDAINHRQQLGHWEVDMMSFAKQNQACLVMVERQSRYLVLQRHNTTKAYPTIQALNTIFAALPKQLRQSATFDNGTEFYQHYQLTTNLNMSTYFCDPHCPWQKGSVENTIKRLRRYLPSKTDTDLLNDNQINALAHNLNHTPRKILGFLTPHEHFFNLKPQPLHFERESTPVVNTGRCSKVSA